MYYLVYIKSLKSHGIPKPKELWFTSYVRARQIQFENKGHILRNIPFLFLASCCGDFLESHSFCILLGESPKTMQKLCLSTTFPQQQIRWNCAIFHSDTKWIRKQYIYDI